MRTVQIYTHPVFEPGVCAKCGSQEKEWFVDLGCNATGFLQNPMQDTEMGDYVYPPIWFDGTLIFCCDCFNSLVVDAIRAFANFYLNNENVRTFPNGFNTESDDGDNPSSESADQKSDVPNPGTSENSSGSEPDKSSPSYYGEARLLPLGPISFPG